MKLSNNAARIAVSVIAIPALVAAAYFGGIYFFLFALLVSLVSFIEFSRMAANKNAKPNLVIGSSAIMLLFFNVYFSVIGFFELMLIIMLLLLIHELFRNQGSAIMNLGATVLGIAYTGFFGIALLGIRENYPDIGDLYTRGGYLVISIFASIWICDSAAYFGGSALGRNKLFPRVSPNKSWEGAIFGFVFAILTLVAARFLVLDFLSWTTVLSIGLITGIIGQIGDLVESLLKRDAAVKDSSSIIPGHGGIFDRFDSLLMASPAIYLLIRYLR